MAFFFEEMILSQRFCFYLDGQITHVNYYANNTEGSVRFLIWSWDSDSSSMKLEGITDVIVPEKVGRNT